jgi:hypothetical protein
MAAVTGHKGKIQNEYQQMVGQVFDRTPKAVIAALVVSLANRLGYQNDEIPKLWLDEWQTLNDNGIVPQKPTIKLDEDDLPKGDDEDARFDQVLAYEVATAGELAELEADQALAVKVSKRAREWAQKWPNHCPSCEGRGWHKYSQSVPYGMGSASFDVIDPCEHCTASQEKGPQKCARCGALALDDDGAGPCKECGWNYDDCVPGY